MFATAVCVLLLAQGPGQDPVHAAQTRRIDAMARCSPAVCSVMDMRSPGGGSGVVIDAAGFVLTNYHVVGEPDTGADDKKKPGDQPPKPKPDGEPADEEPLPPVLPKAPQPPAAVLEQWQKEHAGADAEAQQKFVAGWQQEWREEHLPKGKQQWRNKKVGLPDGQLYEAVVLGVDPGSDLALLRLLPKTDGQKWPACELGDSDALLVGETVFAMGNPFLLATDFTPTVTFGVVSGTHRYQEGAGNRMLVYPDCIQIDAPVNPGNSGGPLFNERGEVVGINGRISIGDRGRVNVGVGFAIASNQIKNFLGDLLAGCHAEHGTLDMSAWYMAAPRETTPRRGVFVQQMFKDSVVAAAGVSLGDEITQFNGTQVRSANQLATLVGVLPAGAWVTLGYRPALADSGYGDGKIVTLRLTALDTGSSADKRADTDRLASRENRRIATQALLRCAGPGQAAGATFALTAPDGRLLRVASAGGSVTIDAGGAHFERGADGRCRKTLDGATVDATPDEAAWLLRESTCNPFCWTAQDRDARFASALLVGGANVLGRPAFRFALPGDGELEFWLLADGTPAGYVLRDPVRKAKVERHVLGGEVRVVVDGALEPGWKIASAPPAGQGDVQRGDR
jgi:S1-C subfamily serine protease